MWQMKHFLLRPFFFLTWLCVLYIVFSIARGKKNSFSISLPIFDWTIFIELLSRGMTVASSLFVWHLIKIFKRWSQATHTHTHTHTHHTTPHTHIHHTHTTHTHAPHTPHARARAHTHTHTHREWWCGKPTLPFRKDGWLKVMNVFVNNILYKLTVGAEPFLRSYQVLRYCRNSSHFMEPGARHLSVSWARAIQFMSPYPTSWRFISVVNSHLRLGLLNYIFNVCHPEVFNTYINIQWCISQTQQNFIVSIIVLGQGIVLINNKHNKVLLCLTDTSLYIYILPNNILHTLLKPSDKLAMEQSQCAFRLPRTMLIEACSLTWKLCLSNTYARWISKLHVWERGCCWQNVIKTSVRPLRFIKINVIYLK